MTEPLSEERLSEFKKAFDLFDRNNNGSIEKDELGEVMESLGLDHDEHQLEEMMKAVDTNKNKVIDFEEFVNLMNVPPECSQEEIIEAFKVFDQNGDGYVTRDELKKVMEGLGEKLSEQEVEEMIKEVDIDGDGKINYQEFVVMMADKD